MEKNRKKSSLIVKLAYVYLVAPFLIFAIGWIKIYYAIPIVVIVLFSFWKACKETPGLWVPDINRDTVVTMFIIVVIVGLWVYFSGIGKFVFQNTDHQTRNSIFNVLVEYKWPVMNDHIIHGVSKIGDVFKNASKTGMIYYIGFWLPSALVGKVFGLRVGYYAQAIWAVLGILLVYYLICAYSKKLAIWPLVLMMGFSGLDIVGNYITGVDILKLGAAQHLEWWSTPYQYSSMTTQLFWVFNQAIPAWICTMALLIQRNNKNIVFLLSCSLLTSTFPFIGLMLLTVFLIFTRKYDGSAWSRKKIKSNIFLIIKDTCTIQNIFGGGMIGIISFIYLKGNLASGIVSENVKGPEFDNSLPKYVIFILVEIIAYLAIIYKYNKENKLYYFIFICLCLFPPIKIGYSTDFCMRASIPALFVLMLMVIQALWKSFELKQYVTSVVIIAILLVGGITPLHEITRTVSETFSRIKYGEIVYEEDTESESLLSLENFAGDIDQSFFFKYLAK